MATAPYYVLLLLVLGSQLTVAALLPVPRYYSLKLTRGVLKESLLREYNAQALLKLRGGGSPTLSSAFGITASDKRDVTVSAVGSLGALMWIKACSLLVQRGLLPAVITRKIIHVTSAPFFVLMWPLYSSSNLRARVWAASVPALSILQLVATGLRSNATRVNERDMHGSDLVQCTSRSGAAEEVLRGPLLYSIVLFFATLIGFRDSPAAVITIAQLAIGDGCADIFGRIFGKRKWWPLLTSGVGKSMEGSVAFVVSAFVGSLALLHWLGLEPQSRLGQYFLFLLAGKEIKVPLRPVIVVLGISILSAVAEITPLFGADDNLVVPMTAMILSRIFFA